MKFPILNQFLGFDNTGKMKVSELAVNRDFIKWMTRINHNIAKTEIALIGSPAVLEVMESVEQIEKLCDVGVQLFKKVEEK